MEFAAGADGNRRDRSPVTWRDRMLAEAVKSHYGIHAEVVLGLDDRGYGFQKGSPTEDESEKCGH
jgi:hypothetical protein